MNKARAPHVETLKVGQDFVGLNDMRDITAIEIAAADPATDPAATPIRMAALMADHFDQVRAEASRPGMPVYFARTPVGIRLHPPADKPYWLRVTYRQPVAYGTRDPLAQP